jgi:hypothetical protein
MSDKEKVERPTTHVRLPTVQAVYETELRAESALIVRCTGDLDLCVKRISPTQVEVWTRKAPTPRPLRKAKDRA